VLFNFFNGKLWLAIENELDRIFRSPHFNLSERKNKTNQQGGATQMASYKDLYEKQQGQEGFGRSPFADRSAHRSNIHKALLMRSPIISEIFPTPKERAERAAQMQSELAEQEEAEEADDGQSSHQARQVRTSSRAEAATSGRSYEEGRGPSGGAYLEG